MQQIAAETNYSETTFVTSAPEHDGGYRVRIFTPAREIAFAGHPILGTAWVIRHHVEPKASGPVRLNLAVGQVPVTFESSAGGGEVAWFLAPPVLLGATCAGERIAPHLEYRRRTSRRGLPVQQCSAGTSAMIVPLRSLKALRRAGSISRRLLLWPRKVSRLSSTSSAPRPITSRMTCARGFSSRPTGCAKTRPQGMEPHSSAHTSWSIASYSGSDLSLRIEQGYEIRRPSLVMLRARTAGSREVRVGGCVIPTVQGQLL